MGDVEALRILEKEYEDGNLLIDSTGINSWVAPI
jgi:hypothetical protein